MLKLSTFLLAAASLASAAPAVTPPPAQPVYIVLYSRFYDHSHPSFNYERVQRLTSLLEKLRTKYPDSGIAGLFGFSGSMSQVLEGTNETMHTVDKLKEASQKGLIDIGYTGEDEPSYLYRPKPDLLSADTPEKRWTAMSDAAEKFLTDFKDPVTGQPFPGLTGGLKRMQEVFGPAAFVRGVSIPLGGDSAMTHEVRKLSPNALMLGIPASDPRHNIESYGASAAAFATAASPVPNTSPEVFRQDGAIRLSDLSKADNKPHSTDEPIEVIQRAFKGLDRSRVRVIGLEFGSYTRYLVKRGDGSVVYDPMEWLYYHPDDPSVPQTMKMFLPNDKIDAGYKNEEDILNWLLTDYLPANPGSRFISISDLKKMAQPELPSEVTWNQIQSLAADSINQFKTHPNRVSDYLHADDLYFSNGEAFYVMAEALAAAEKNGSPAARVRPVPMWGPITLPNDMGPFKGSVTVREVIHAAAQLAPSLRHTGWSVIPANAVPAYVQVGAMKLNAAQFLHLMVWTCQDPTPDRVLTLNAIESHSDFLFRYPRNTPITDQGMGWTIKPVPLQLAPPGAPTAGK